MNGTMVALHIDGPHAVITLATEGGLNVLTSSVLHELGAAISRVGKATGIRTAAIQAEGKVFVAGADIKEMAPFDSDRAHEYGRLGQDVFNELAGLPVITVASINGPALGGGLELALACDFRIAVKSAKLGTPETSLGLIPGWAGIGRLPKLIGMSQAKRLFFSALPISAEDGLKLGLVDEIVNSPEDLPARVAAFCKSFRRGSPQAIAQVKRALRDGNDLTAFADCFGMRDAREGMAAFMEKRAASWME